MSFAEIDSRFPDIAVAVAAPDGVNNAFDAADHGRPIGAHLSNRDAKPPGRASLVERVSGADERLSWITAGVKAGAAHFPLLGHRHACTLPARFSGGGAPGSAGADDDQIVCCGRAARHGNSFSTALDPVV